MQQLGVNVQKHVLVMQTSRLTAPLRICICDMRIVVCSRPYVQTCIAVYQPDVYAYNLRTETWTWIILVACHQPLQCDLAAIPRMDVDNVVPHGTASELLVCRHPGMNDKGISRTLKETRLTAMALSL